MNIVSSSAHDHFDGRRATPSRGELSANNHASSQSSNADQQSARSCPAHEFIGQAYKVRFDSRVEMAIDAYQAQETAEKRSILSGMMGIDVFA